MFACGTQRAHSLCEQSMDHFAFPFALIRWFHQAQSVQMEVDSNRPLHVQHFNDRQMENIPIA